MPFFNYGAKNGMASIVKYVRLLCRVYLKFETPITLYINGLSVLTAPQKTLILDWLATGHTVCTLIETSVEVTYENP